MAKLLRHSPDGTPIWQGRPRLKYLHQAKWWSRDVRITGDGHWLWIKLDSKNRASEFRSPVVNWHGNTVSLRKLAWDIQFPSVACRDGETVLPKCDEPKCCSPFHGEKLMLKDVQRDIASERSAAVQANMPLPAVLRIQKMLDELAVAFRELVYAAAGSGSSSPAIGGVGLGGVSVGGVSVGGVLGPNEASHGGPVLSDEEYLNAERGTFRDPETGKMYPELRAAYEREAAMLETLTDEQVEDYRNAQARADRKRTKARESARGVITETKPKKGRVRKASRERARAPEAPEWLDSEEE